MKRYVSGLGTVVCVVSFLLFISVTGCDTGTGIGGTEENRLTINGQTYVLSNLYHKVIDDEVVDFILFLGSEDIDYDGSSEPSGTGAYISIYLWHENGASGRYVHGEEEGVGNSFALEILCLYPCGDYERNREGDVTDGVIDLEVISENAYTIA